MKKVIAIFATLALFAITGQNVMAQNTASGDAGASAYIVEPLSITKNVDLDFGNIVPTNADGEVEILPAGSRNFHNGAQIFLNDQTFSAAEFEVNGENNATFSIVLPPDNVVELTGSGVAMPLVDFGHNSTLELDGNGVNTFNVGATLEVGAGQATGAYTGQFTVTVAYN